MVSEKVKRASKILNEIYRKIGDKENIIASEEEVLKKYQPKFSQETIGRLTFDDFLGFLDSNNNKHWSHIDRYARLNRSFSKRFESEVRPAFVELMNDAIEIEKRIDKCFEVKGLNKATITPMLLVEFPNKYGVWNEISESALKTLGVWLDTYKEKSSVKLSPGETYKFVNETLIEMSGEMGVDLWSLDAILYYYQKYYPDETCIALEVGKEYSRKDLCDMFSPEYKFSPQYGIWGRTGVSRINMGKRKDYALFVVSEKSKDRKTPEKILDDGTFDWITQQWMKKGKSKREIELKNGTNSKVILFIKENEEDEKYIYYGTIQYLREYKDEKGDRRFIYHLDSWPEIKHLYESTYNGHFIYNYPINGASLEKEDPPHLSPKSENGGITEHRHGAKTKQYPDDEMNRKLGEGGEILVEKYEKNKLKGTGFETKVERISIYDDSAGYDIKSYEVTGEEIFIEVKTTRGDKNTPFYISANEYEVSKKYKSKYKLYRLFEYDRAKGAKFYVIEGSLDKLSPEPTKYIVKVREENL